jgi:hypothetical protein
VKRIVNIPKPESVANISKAWEYAAKVCLRLREKTILFPPTPNSDKVFAQTIYDDIFDFFPFNQGLLDAFETRHISTPAKNIKSTKKQHSTDVQRTTERKEGEVDDFPSNKYAFSKTNHVHLHPDSGRITQVSVAYLYGAIVCFIMRDETKNLPLRKDLPLPADIAEEITKTIYWYFHLLGGREDLRHYVGWNNIFRLILDIENHGFSAAAKKNPTGSIYCRTCSNIRSRQFVIMETPESSPGNDVLICPQCRGSEQLPTYYSTKHFKNMRNNSKTLKNIEEMVEYAPKFGMVKYMCRNLIKENFEVAMKRFREYELLAQRDLLSIRECYFVVHYDSSKKWKKRSCYIPDNQLQNVLIDDFRYDWEYIPLIRELVSLCNNNGTLDAKRHLLTRISDILEKIGWPRRYLADKIQADYSAANI